MIQGRELKRTTKACLSSNQQPIYIYIYICICMYINNSKDNSSNNNDNKNRYNHGDIISIIMMVKNLSSIK